VWARTLKRMGVRRFEYFADHIEPVVFRRVHEERSEFFKATVEAVKREGLEIWSGATARVSYLLNMLSHPYEDMRECGREWMRAFVDETRAFGAKYISGHYDCMSFAQADGDLDGWIDRVCDELAGISVYAKEKGLDGIFLEQMHRPQLQPNTISRAQYMLDRINAKSEVPFHIHIDTGHMAHVSGDPAHTARDKDPMKWLETPFGRNEMLLVHAQQTDAQASRHWPFTKEYNRKGIIDARKAIEAIERSGVKKAFVALEILFPRGTRIEEMEPALVESAEYWRSAFKALGYTERDCILVKE
jgi:sugar phosphate isomerase/epimerase